MKENDIYLVNYRCNDSEPLKSITQLSKEDAYSTAEQLYKNNPCRAHRRFGPDFPVYYKHRLRTEKWLYDCFIDLGGKPETRRPYYFALHYCDNYYRNFDFGKEVKIKLSNIDIYDISFTFGDSVAQMDSKDKKLPFLKDKLLEYILFYNNDVELFINNIKEQYVCIEAQLWTDKYFDFE